MNFWETITGSDLTREWKAFETRAEALPADYRAAWEEIKGHLSPYSDFAGRNLMPILDAALGLLEQTAADGQSIHEVLGDDIEGFCAALAGGEGGPIGLLDGPLLSGIIDFFEEGVAASKGVLELTGNDVAAFCDDLVKDSRTYADIYQESIGGEPGTAEK